MSVHVLHLADEEPTFTSELGSLTIGNKDNFPILNTMSIARITLAPGAFREPHWTVAANALGYCTAGRLLVTIFHSGNQHEIFVIDPGQMFFVPAGSLHTVENLAQVEAAFLVSYSQPTQEGFGLSGSVGTFTRGVIGNTLGLAVDKLPKEMVSEARDMWIGRVDGEAVIPHQAEFANPYKFAVEEIPAQLQTEGGSAKFARSDTWPVLDSLSMYSLYFNGVGMREPHWHPLTSELGFILEGHGRMTVRNPGANSFDTYTLAPGDIYYMPRSYPHHIENLDDTQTHFAVFFDRAMPNDIGFTGSLSSVARRILAPTLGVREEDLPVIRDVPVDLMFVEKTNPMDPVTPDQQS
jgi:oxalate decarboxylase